MGVVVLAGPSGSGKSRLAARLGWPVLRLDDFYREHCDPGMPQSSLGIIDWDDPASWDHGAAIAAITSLCHSGTAEVPIYDIGKSERTGLATLAAPEGRFVAEGLFATQIIDECRKAGILDAAICVRHHRIVTFLLRLSRDRREGRKAPHVLVRRGWRLMRAEPAIIADAVAHGCTPMTPRQAEKFLHDLPR
ncbi:MAG: ATP-binding protein [Actinomycetota bacterium]|nr:ATP-binding protein [Actinomycetota bacterium]